MTGRCLCSGVRFALAGPARDVVVCHCSLCRRSGTLAGAYTAVDRDGLRTSSSETLSWYVDVNGRNRGFCARCGSTLFWATEEGATISVSAGALDGPTGLAVERHVFLEDTADWERAQK